MEEFFFISGAFLNHPALPPKAKIRAPKLSIDLWISLLAMKRFIANLLYILH